MKYLSVRSLAIALLCVTWTASFSQEKNSEKGTSFACGTDLLLERLIDKDPKVLERIKANREARAQGLENPVDRAGQVYRIPVVFHVVHEYGSENLPRSVLKDAIDQLNTDFLKQNADTTDVVAPYDTLIGDAEVEFRLAQKDPNGNCHPGITRTVSDLTEHQMGDGLKDLVHWDRSMYMNVWVVRSISGGGSGTVAGYAIKPGSLPGWYPDYYDGIVMDHNYVGDGERSLTHEVGHFLGLDHTWGTVDNSGNQLNPGETKNCDYDDGIPDTDTTEGWQFCDPSGSTCGSPDNVQNYMEYSFCSRMFTPDQVTVMRNALNSSAGERDQLWQSSNLQATGTDGNDQMCKAKVRAEKRMVCAGESIQFFDESYHGATSWTWSFEGGTANDPNAQNPVVTYNDTGIYNVSLTASNANGTADTTLQDFIKVVRKPGYPLPFIETFDWPALPLNDHKKYLIHDRDQDGVKWEWTDETGEGGSRGSIKLNNYDLTAGQVNMFETTAIDASDISGSNLEIAFDAAYARQSTGNGDELIVHVSNNCGTDWSLSKSFPGGVIKTADPTTDPFIPGDNEWKRHTINSALGSFYNEETLRIRFEFISDGGNNVFIDNINVYHQDNVGLEEIEEASPELSVNPNPVEEKAHLQLELPSEKKVRIEVRDLLGKKVVDQEKGHMNKGDHRMELDMAGLDAGPYFIILHADGERSTQKIFKK